MLFLWDVLYDEVPPLRHAIRRFVRRWWKWIIDGGNLRRQEAGGRRWTWQIIIRRFEWVCRCYGSTLTLSDQDRVTLQTRGLIVDRDMEREKERPGGIGRQERDKDRGTSFLYWLVSTVTCQYCWKNIVGCELDERPYYLRITIKQRLFHLWYWEPTRYWLVWRDKIWSRLTSWVKLQVWWFDHLAGARIAPPTTALDNFHSSV